MTSKPFLMSIIPLLLIHQVTLSSENISTPTSSFLGTKSYERVGYHLHTAGDVNHDGYDDFLIGTFHNDTNGYNSGAAYLIYGKTNAEWGFSTSLTTANARFIGANAYDAVGYCLGGGGDVNGDGFNDILIGAPAGDDLVPENPGHFYLVFGKSNPNWGYYFELNSQANASFDGEHGHELAGLSVAFIGDMNGDGYDEVICGAPGNDYRNTDGGKAYLILGKASGWSRGINLSQADASFYGSSVSGLVGYAVEGVGDVNNDDIPDFVIGARGEGKVYLFYGRKNVNWGKNYNIQQADVIFNGEQSGNWTGGRVSAAGDVNKDGFDDFLIGAPLHDQVDSDSDGKVYLILGRSSGWYSNLANADASFIGEQPRDEAGWDVQDAGDVDGDGYDDFLIGALYNDANGTDTGKMYLIKGKASGWQRNVNLSQINDYFWGENNSDYAGYSVASAGDVNNDGLSDILTSAPFNSEAYYWGGKIYLFVSPNSNPPATITITSPNGGELWEAGSIHDILWSSNYLNSNIKIEYSSNGGTNWSLVANSTENDGAYSWTIPDNPSVNCLVRVQDVDGNPSDQSDAVFTIKKIQPRADLRASISGDNILLEWSPCDGATGYNVYRDTIYDFQPDRVNGSNRIAAGINDEDPTTSGIQWTDTGNGANIVGDVNKNYFYRVTVLTSVESEPSNVAGEFDYKLLITDGTDINEIVLLMHTKNTRLPITNAEQLIQAIPNGSDVYYWDAAGQGTVGHPKGVPFNNFAVYPGYPYIVNVTANGIWSVAGSYSDTSFNLLTTDNTDINHLGVPLSKASLNTAEELGQDIPGCTDVYYWDTEGQGTVGHIIGLPFGNFAVREGYPYYVNMTSPAVWPAMGGSATSLAPILEKNWLIARGKPCSTGGGIPHTVYGKVRNLDGMALPDRPLKIRAWIVSRPHELITEEKPGIGSDGQYWWVGVSNFSTHWQAGECLYVEISDPSGDLQGSTRVALTEAGSDDGGEIQLSKTNTHPETNLKEIPNEFILSQNYPHPFNFVTIMKLRLLF